MIPFQTASSRRSRNKETERIVKKDLAGERKETSTEIPNPK